MMIDRYLTRCFMPPEMNYRTYERGILYDADWFGGTLKMLIQEMVVMLLLLLLCPHCALFGDDRLVINGGELFVLLACMFVLPAISYTRVRKLVDAGAFSGLDGEKLRGWQIAQKEKK